LFSIGTIWSVETTNVEIMDTNAKTSKSMLKSITKQKTTSNKYEPKVALEDKVYFEMYYNHQPRSVAMDETPTKIRT
jgi:hypothetical protein